MIVGELLAPVVRLLWVFRATSQLSVVIVKDVFGVVCLNCRPCSGFIRRPLHLKSLDLRDSLNGLLTVTTVIVMLHQNQSGLTTIVDTFVDDFVCRSC